jgi:hypothetical protein
VVDRTRILEEWIGVRVAHDPRQLAAVGRRGSPSAAAEQVCRGRLRAMMRANSLIGIYEA